MDSQTAENGSALGGAGAGAAVESLKAGTSAVDFAALRQVPMTVQVEVGRSIMTLGEILDRLDVGACVRLDRHPGDPVEIYINGALFARAEVVLIDDQIGARIIELAEPTHASRGAGLR